MGDYDKILLFDGVCYLCNSLVRFVIRRDKKALIRFASLQSESGKSILSDSGLTRDSIDTVVYKSGQIIFLKSSAVLNLFKDLGGGWMILYSLVIIPAFIRDFFYDMIAKSRYRIFGRRETCMIPSEEIESRFIL